MVPLVVLGVRGMQHAIPVEGAGVATHRSFLNRNVFVSPGARIGATLDGGVLSRQTKRVPPDWVHDVKSLLNPVAGDHITEGIGLGMAHVQIPRWVREHIQDILLGTWVLWATRLKWLYLIPDGQPLLLYSLDVISLMHEAHSPMSRQSVLPIPARGWLPAAGRRPVPYRE